MADEKRKLYTCPVCKTKKDDPTALYQHVSLVHGHDIPLGMSVEQFVFNKKYKKEYSLCVVCRIHHTKWNPILLRYERFCEEATMDCEAEYRKIFLNRMTKRPDHVLSNPEVQSKLLRARAISGEFSFDNDPNTSISYTASFELDFLKYLNTDHELPPGSVKNCEFVFYYEFEGEKHFYMPDFYMPEFNLIIEIKDGGDNPNQHPKIQAVDKPKEILKDAAVKNSKSYNFIKIANKDYKPFEDLLDKLAAREVSNDPKAFFCVIPE